MKKRGRVDITGRVRALFVGVGGQEMRDGGFWEWYKGLDLQGSTLIMILLLPRSRVAAVQRGETIRFVTSSMSQACQTLSPLRAPLEIWAPIEHNGVSESILLFEIAEAGQDDR